MKRRAGALAAAVALALAGAAPLYGQAPADEPADEIEASALSKLPRPLGTIELEYPAEARAQGIEAEVILLLDLSAEGKVEAVGIAQPADPPGLGFDEAAMAAALGLEFEPAEMDGTPIAVQITYRVRFTLTEVAPTAPPAAPDTLPSEAPPPPPRPPRTPVVNFSGSVIERGTRLPMPGVLVTIFRDDGEEAIGFEATADAAGAFQFYDLAAGAWKVLIEAPGYYPFRTTEEIVTGEATAVTYHVERGSYNPYDVMVTAPRPRKEVSRTVLSAQEIDKIPGAAGDPLAVVQNFAGVARAPSFSGQIIVRGSAPQDSRVFIDGTEVPLIYHFGGLRSVVPVGILEGIEFYPGNFSPYYGRATGGIIDVKPKQIAPEKVGGYADVSLLDTGVFLEVPLGAKGGIAIAARRSYIDAILLAVIPSNAPINLITAPRYYDAQVVASYRPAPAHDLRAMIFASDDRLEVLFDNPADIDPSFAGNSVGAATTFYRSLWSYRYVPSERFENVLRISQGRNWLDLRGGQLLFDLDVYVTQLRNTTRHTLGPRVALSYGVDVLYGRADALIRLPRPPREGEPPGSFDLDDTLTAEIDGFSEVAPAAFIEAELSPIEGLLILPGLRVDYFSRLDQAIAQPRLTARWQQRAGVTFKGGAGMFAQPPRFDETDETFGNPELDAEQALHLSAGVELKPRPWITLDVTGFYKRMWDMVSRSDELVATADGARPLVYDNEGKGAVIGVELVARHDFANNLSGWIAYTLSRAERRDSGIDGSRLFDYDQTHILTAIVNYALPRNWQVGSRFRLVSGNPSTPVVGSVFNASADRYDPVYGAVNSDRNSPFHQLDLRVDKRWIYQSWMLNLYLDIQNVYNRANPEGLSYNFDFSESRPQQGLPLLTILGIRAEF